jgi:hypothetical protein
LWLDGEYPIIDSAMSYAADTSRTEPRTSANISTTIRLFDPDRQMSAEIVDFSDHGMGLVVGVTIPKDAAIVVDYIGVWILGDVVYCVPESNRFRVGLRLRKALATQSAAASTQASVAQLSSMRVGGFRLRGPR